MHASLKRKSSRQCGNSHRSGGKTTTTTTFNLSVQLEPHHENVMIPARVRSSHDDPKARKGETVGVVDLPRRGRVCCLCEGRVVGVSVEHHPLNAVIGPLQVPVSQHPTSVVVAVSEVVPLESNRHCELHGHPRPWFTVGEVALFLAWWCVLDEFLQSTLTPERACSDDDLASGVGVDVLGGPSVGPHPPEQAAVAAKGHPTGVGLKRPLEDHLLSRLLHGEQVRTAAGTRAEETRATDHTGAE
jgi:hypothetical protein